MSVSFALISGTLAAQPRGDVVPANDNGESELVLGRSFRQRSNDGLRIAPGLGRPPSYRFTLDEPDELEELAGYPGCRSESCEGQEIEKELRRLYARIAEVEESYTDQPGGSAR